ncbi:restriction endonuclease subunit S [Streptomyces luteogriseus]|uniref:restriction endonuclease subunit S n=1 Tax=Streptomyces luteogriseus TaxID=68233 RepID=UPI003803FBC0
MTSKVLPLRRLFRIVNGGTPTPDAENWGGDIPWATPADFGETFGPLRTTRRSLTRKGVNTGSTVVPKGAILLSTRAPIGYVAVSEVAMAFNQGCRALVPTVDVDSRFFGYQLESAKEYLQAQGLGTTFLELSSSALAQVPVVAPSREQQRRIADFLDAETARFEALAYKRARQIEGLAERELALIVDMLSGSCKSGEGRPTGWPWLPEIPAEWSVGPVYAYFSTELGKMLNAERASGPDQRPYLRNANVHWYTIETDDLASMDFSPDEVSRYSVRQGDLLVCEGGAGVAEAAVWDGRLQECYFQKSLHRVRRAGPVPVEWLMYWLRLAKACGVFEAEGNIATIPHLTGEQLRQYRIPIPNDGDSLVKRIGEEIAGLTSVRTKLMQAQNLLAERRQTLITAAVTGQIDVSAASGRGIEE